MYRTCTDKTVCEVIAALDPLVRLTPQRLRGVRHEVKVIIAAAARVKQKALSLLLEARNELAGC